LTRVAIQSQKVMLCSFTRTLHLHPHHLQNQHYHPVNQVVAQTLLQHHQKMANNSTVQDYIKSMESLRKNNRDRLHQAAMKWNELANNRSADLSKYLFTIASLVLPLSLLPVTQEGFTVADVSFWKIILVFAWALFVTSLIFGLIHLAKEVDFFNGWGRQENERGKAYSEGIFTTKPQMAFNRLEKMNQESAALAKMPSTTNPLYLQLQEGTLILGTILIGIVLSLKLFSNAGGSHIKQQIPKLPNWNRQYQRHNFILLQKRR
jgi:hypothetical protein